MTTRPNLVYIGSGPNAVFRQWFDTRLPRTWDLMLGWYGPALPILDDAYTPDRIHHNDTTRRCHQLNGFSRLCAAGWIDPSRYESIAILCDDVLFRNPHDVDILFSLHKQYDMALSQPSLTRDCPAGWAFVRSVRDSIVRYTNFVESMAWVFDTRFLLETAVHHFDDNVSGWGVDMLVSRKATEAGLNIGIFDCLQVVHTKAISGPTGGYNRLMHVDAASESRLLAQKHGLKEWQTPTVLRKVLR